MRVVELLKLRNFSNNIKVGMVVTCSYAVLKKKLHEKAKRNVLIKKKYFWTVLHFTGLCIYKSVRSNFILVKNYFNLIGFTLRLLFTAPNVIRFFVWNKRLLTFKKSLNFLIKKQDSLLLKIQ